MFWKKSKDQPNKTKSSSKIVYRTDGGTTSTGSAITSYEAKMKASSKGSSSKTTITVSTKQTSTETRKFSEVKTYTSDSSKWMSSSSSLNPTQKAILPRQKTEPSIVRRIDATPFNSKYESPYRNANLPTLRTLALPTSSSTTTTTYEYHSPYRNTNSTSSMRMIAPSRTVTSTATALLASAPKTKSTTTIWNPMSSLENTKPGYTTKPLNPSPKPVYSWNNISSLPAKTSSPQVQVPTVKPPPPPVAAVGKKKKLSPGVVYIFHNDKFDSSDKEFRIGSAEDVRVLKKTFQSYKMQVNLYENLTVKEVDNMIRKIEIKDFGNASCIVVVILTHGTRYETVAAKDGSYSIDDNVLFPILRNRSLRSKPKLLFIQACKGGMETGGFHKDAIPPNGVPDEILKCYSTFEGYVAYRSEKGSLFIQALCELLKIHGKSKTIKDIMDMVIRRVKEASEGKQIPSYETTLTEPYIFGDYV